MGFYIRKTIRLGGVNLNLSKSGLGVSAGVRGFRVGMNGRGTYVHMGRGGLYYREQLSWRRQGSGAPPPSYSPSPAAYETPTADGVYAVERMVQPLEVNRVSASDAEILKHFRKRFEWSNVLVVLSVWGLLALGSSRAWAIGLSLATLAGLALRYLQGQRSILVYDLEDEALAGYQAFVEAFGSFFQSQKMWLYEERQYTTDWKRNAGATRLMKRRDATALPSGDPAIRTNLSIPCLNAGDERIYFLPDLVVVRQGSAVAAYRYPALDLRANLEVFIDERPPRDAEVIGYAWQYSNKDGSRDLRFNNNHEIPRCRYQAVAVRLGDQFSRTFSKSSIREAASLLAGLRRLDNLQRIERPAIGPAASAIVS